MTYQPYISSDHLRFLIALKLLQRIFEPIRSLQLWRKSYADGHVTSSLTCNNSSGDRAMVMQSWLRAAIKMSDASPSSTDYGHPDRDFFLKSQAFGLEQTNWNENVWGIWGIFGQFISKHFGTVGAFFINQPLF